MGHDVALELKGRQRNNAYLQANAKGNAKTNANAYAKAHTYVVYAYTQIHIAYERAYIHTHECGYTHRVI